MGKDPQTGVEAIWAPPPFGAPGPKTLAILVLGGLYCTSGIDPPYKAALEKSILSSGVKPAQQ